jgi:hypothetical protein
MGARDVLLWTATPDHLVVALVALWRASEILTLIPICIDLVNRLDQLTGL